jgi:type I restriction enzyme S subunit
MTLDVIAFVTKLAGFEYTKFVRYDPEGDLPVIKAENISNHGFRPTEFSFVRSETVEHLIRSRVRKNDLLMVFIGANLGLVARLPVDRQYFLGPNVALIRVTSTLIAPTYLEWYLRSAIGFAMTRARSKATAQGSISMSEIRQISVAVAPPAEQVRIVEELERRVSNLVEVESQAGSVGHYVRLDQ